MRGPRPSRYRRLRRLPTGRPAALQFVTRKSVIRVVSRQNPDWHCRPCTRYCILSESIEQASYPDAGSDPARGIGSRRKTAGQVLGQFRGQAGGAGGIVTDKIVILVTAANRDEGHEIARHLVESQLAACVNILPPIESVYRWQGQVAEEGEFLLIVKSSKALFAEIEAEILKLHSYKTPEIICLSVDEGSPNYLQWIADSVKPPGATRSS